MPLDDHMYTYDRSGQLKIALLEFRLVEPSLVFACADERDFAAGCSAGAPVAMGSNGPSAPWQDRAGHRRQRGHRQGHRARARQGRRRRRDLRAAQGRARSRRRRDRQGDQPQDRRRSRPTSRKDADAKNFIEQAHEGARPRRHHGQQRRLRRRRRDRAPDRGRLGERPAAQVHGLRALPALRAADHGQAGRRPRGEPDRQRRREAVLLGDRARAPPTPPART